MGTKHKVNLAGVLTFCLGIIFMFIDYGTVVADTSFNITEAQSLEYLNTFFLGYGWVIIMPAVYFSLMIVGIVMILIAKFILKEYKKPERAADVHVEVDTNVPRDV